MLVRLLVILGFFIPSFCLVIRQNVHMFQLNEYKMLEHFKWLKKNILKQWLLIPIFVFGLLNIFVESLFVDIILCVFMLLIICSYYAMMRMNTKKALVITARIKRLLITISLFAMLIIILTFVLFGLKYICPSLCLLLSCSWLFVLIANIINIPLEKLICKYYINDAKKILRNIPNLIVVGITGSFGKTSVKYFLKTLLQDSYNTISTPGNFNTTLGVTKTIRQDLNKNCEIFLCEMGARKIGEIKEICNIVNPRYGVITAIGSQHLETFGTIDNVTKTKFELGDSIPDDGLLFLNGDYTRINDKATEYSNSVIYSIKDNKEAKYFASDISFSSNGSRFSVTNPKGEKVYYQTKLIGKHNVSNVLCAIAVANSLGVPMNKLIVPVRRLLPVEHRMQIINNENYTIIDDAYNSNPVGSKAAIETLGMFDGVRILVTPGMVELGDKEYEYNYQLGSIASGYCDYIFLIGKKLTKAIYEGVTDSGFDKDKIFIYNRLDEAMIHVNSIEPRRHKYILLENDLPDNY